MSFLDGGENMYSGNFKPSDMATSYIIPISGKVTNIVIQKENNNLVGGRRNVYGIMALNGLSQVLLSTNLTGASFMMNLSNTITFNDNNISISLPSTHYFNNETYYWYAW